MKVTPWYPPEIAPVREGVYEVPSELEPSWYRYWDGKQWYAGRPTIEQAAIHDNGTIALWDRRDWRGLTKPTAPELP